MKLITAVDTAPADLMATGSRLILSQVLGLIGHIAARLDRGHARRQARRRAEAPLDRSVREGA